MQEGFFLWGGRLVLRLPGEMMKALEQNERAERTTRTSFAP